MLFLPLDLAALAWFTCSWLGYNWLVERSRWKTSSLSHAMDSYRHQWMHAMLARPLRMIDAQIMSGLQQGTAFFASTSLLALGACFALLNATDLALAVYADLPLAIATTRAEWEAKVLGLLLIAAYAFFKFGWSYRLFNYCSIMVGAVPNEEKEPSPEARALVARAGDLNVLAGRHFSRGQRAFFFAVGFLCWFAGPIPFIAGTTCVLVVLLRRQFFSAARTAATTQHIDSKG
ncbi:putative membrane protein [Breoghania corrubedonensis]|uniref:Putative membrane protein n=1 Tax=Breoghania corrubedonensis TaxID=665038 RepID=A0A2T5VCL8_9HYPH|nr:DUF599 family protein [Breoghania corrubedonensis]PTW61503.1 putative membrane protein [Breoghania corrubedonensis]